MARSRIVSLLRRTSTTTIAHRGAPPPSAPFARNLAPTEKLVENHDAMWDDGVAPEVTIDFDAPHITTGQAAKIWLSAFGGFFTLYQFCKWVDPPSKNPCVPRDFAMVQPPPKTNFDDM
mmetsp:Transcript_19928/g.24621  ORF Transcript_19928/g.24621 Transcript_19928/m.24621 type:complete len:119 (-) Transcript_19928:249-605(-)|eukprot:CAMPEP_0172516748 /NCGR_PEP_ID=MMETSP1066-20121228/278736_1 /TAXON_ID=671091 /ORGANISM="Coscinodiscus wailesii, Strain CCMP2513" /LENGTH=118 /DNA_ID=CAMNT_0013298355 /DNA_START=159 /DNA_END=515 /DNA_ORIENTATION=+